MANPYKGASITFLNSKKRAYILELKDPNTSSKVSKHARKQVELIDEELKNRSRLN